MAPLSLAFRRSILALSLVAAFSVASSGCGHGQKKEDESAPTTDVGSVDENAMGDSDSGKALGMQTVHFPFDSFVLSADNKKIAKDNAKILKKHPDVKIQIEGHCDKKGGIQYNIALGEKRANAVKKYLTGLGIAEDRITTISYGKERPIDNGDSEDAYAKNRRANFVITSK